MRKIYCVLTAIAVMMMFVGCPDGTNGENGNVGNNDVTVNVAVPSYTVIFSANGGQGTMSKMVCEIGKAYDVPKCEFSRQGYIFAGWDGLLYRGSGSIRSKQIVYNLSETDGDIIVLSAQWIKKWTIDESGDFVTGEGKFFSKTGGMVQILSKDTGFICDQDEGAFMTKRNRIVLSKYSISKYEVTMELYYAVMGIDFVEDITLKSIEGVEWIYAIVFCNRLSILTDKTPCYNIECISDWCCVKAPCAEDYFIIYDDHNQPHNGDEARYKEACRNWYNIQCDWNANGYRLPTELEWECAARGGVYSDRTSDPWNYMYSGSNNYDDVVSFGSIVGSKSPNTLGLYDMSGNAPEFCWDAYEEINADTPLTGPDTRYTNEESVDVIFPFDHINKHVIKGAAYSSSKNQFKVFYREEYSIAGIRLACTVE